MRNEKKGSYVKIYKDPTGKRNDYVLEIGTEFDAYQIAVDFCDLVTIKNDITKIEDRNKQTENERD